MRNDNVFGLDVTVRSRAEMAAPDAPRIVVVSRCVDLPLHTIPEPFRSRNKRTICRGCGAFCWADPVYFPAGHLSVLCQQCAPDDVEINVVDEQIAEVRRAVGL